MTENRSDTAAAPKERKSLRERILKGGALSLFGFGGAQAIRLFSNLVMTRLLVPEAFGLVAIAISLQVLMIMLSDLGIGTSVIRSQSSEYPRFLSTAWTTQIARGVVIGIALFLVAGFLAIFAPHGIFADKSVFSDPRLPIFVVAVGVTAMLDGARSLKMILCQRELRLGHMISLEIGAQLIGLAAMIIVAINGAGAYSLIVSMLLASSIIFAGSYLFLPGPKINFGFDKKYFKELFHFGKWLILASLFAFLIQRGDQFIFGSIMTREEFGFYAIATTWITVVILLYDIVQTRIAYPAISEVWRERPQDTARIYYRFRMAFDAMALIVFLGVILLVDFAFDLLYPQNYSQVAVYVKFLAIIILLLPYRLMNSVILAEGKSQNFMKTLIGPVIMIIIFTPMVYHFSNIRTAIIFSTLAYIPSIAIISALIMIFAT